MNLVPCCTPAIGNGPDILEQALADIIAAARMDTRFDVDQALELLALRALHRRFPELLEDSPATVH